MPNYGSNTREWLPIIETQLVKTGDYAHVAAAISILIYSLHEKQSPLAWQGGNPKT